MMSDTNSLTVERSIPGPIDQVFDAWLDPAMLSRWMTPGPGMSVPAAETNPVVGGRYRIVMRAGDRDLAHEGVYQVIERPTKLVFTWNSEPAGRDTLVTITFTKKGDAETLITLTHERFATAAIRDGHRSGWTKILDALAGTMSA